MIIVKDKGKQSRIYIQRSSVQLTDNNVVVDDSNVNIVELKQSEYDELKRSGEINSETLYMISDAVVNLPYIKGAEMVEYVDDIVGDINKILEDIIG